MREPWPVPDRRAAQWGANAASLTLGGLAAVTLGLLGATGGTPLSGWRERSAPDRMRQIAGGRDEHVPAAVFGAASWCPRFPEWGVLRLSTSGVTYHQGRERVLPVESLVPTGVREARSVSTPVRARRGWVLGLTGPDGEGSVVLRSIADVALLGGVAGWRPPPGWADRPSTRTGPGPITHESP